MKTKIIYISGNEVFNMADIRAAFEEVRIALNLDKNTVMFGVPVDADDAGIMPENEHVVEQNDPAPVLDEQPDTEIESEQIEAPKKRGRPRKEHIVLDDDDESMVEKSDGSDESIKTDEIPETSTEEIPILSVLSVKENTDIAENSAQDAVENIAENVDIITEIVDEKIDDAVENVPESEENSEPDLEKLLSEMTPLAEDVSAPEPKEIVSDAIENDISVDATLEQLATEFAENQDKIAAESKSQSRSKIGKLRNILPFKQSKHRDQGIGDLLEWAGIAANDEDFSVPGFFTNVASKK